MQIQVNTDRNIEGGQALKDEVRGTISAAIGRFEERITRVEVHLSDRNSAVKGGGADMRCVLEARPAGMNPISVSHEAATLDQAVAGATDKLEKTLQRNLDRLGRTKGRTPYGGEDPA
jgi:ribosome-associated translation inhibitor RaiA